MNRSEFIRTGQYKIEKRGRKWLTGKDDRGRTVQIEINPVSSGWQSGDIVSFTGRVELSRGKYGSTAKVYPLTDVEKSHVESERNTRRVASLTDALLRTAEKGYLHDGIIGTLREIAPGDDDVEEAIKKASKVVTRACLEKIKKYMENGDAIKAVKVRDYLQSIGSEGVSEAESVILGNLDGYTEHIARRIGDSRSIASLRNMLLKIPPLVMGRVGGGIREKAQEKVLAILREVIGEKKPSTVRRAFSQSYEALELLNADTGAVRALEKEWTEELREAEQVLKERISDCIYAETRNREFSEAVASTSVAQIRENNLTFTVRDYTLLNVEQSRLLSPFRKRLREAGLVVVVSRIDKAFTSAGSIFIPPATYSLWFVPPGMEGTVEKHLALARRWQADVFLYLEKKDPLDMCDTGVIPSTWNHIKKEYVAILRLINGEITRKVTSSPHDFTGSRKNALLDSGFESIPIGALMVVRGGSHKHISHHFYRKVSEEKLALILSVEAFSWNSVIDELFKLWEENIERREENRNV